MADTVRAKHEKAPLVLQYRLESVPQHRVGHLGAKTGRNGPADYRPVEATRHGTEMDLPRGDAELRDVGGPQEVG